MPSTTEETDFADAIQRVRDLAYARIFAQQEFEANVSVAIALILGTVLGYLLA